MVGQVCGCDGEVPQSAFATYNEQSANDHRSHKRCCLNEEQSNRGEGGRRLRVQSFEDSERMLGQGFVAEL